MRRFEFGMSAAGNNRFATACELLWQYMREPKHQQSPPRMEGLVAGSFVLPPPRETMEEDAEETDARTMQLFPTHAGTSLPPSSQKRPEERDRAPLTIFYEGRALVFEDFPADKAEELMHLAGSGSSPPAVKNEVELPEKLAVVIEPPRLPISDLPIARKASLKRFLQKRKHRIIATDPYKKETEAAEGSKPVNGEPAASWLAL